MTIKPLYKTIRPDGGVTVSPNKPFDGVEYTESVRIIADGGKLITLDGTNLYPCIDADCADGWYEVEEENTDGEALEFITGGVIA